MILMIMMTIIININNDDHNNDDDGNNHNHTINNDNHNDTPEFVVTPPAPGETGILAKSEGGGFTTILQNHNFRGKQRGVYNDFGSRCKCS